MKKQFYSFFVIITLFFLFFPPIAHSFEEKSGYQSKIIQKDFDSHEGQQKESPKQKSSKYILDNGLTVLINEMPSSPIVSVYALVKTGSATEGKFLGTGISHFLEHMLFKGTSNRGVGEIAAQIQAIGGSINASTSMDYTIYTLNVPFDAFDVALDVLSDMLMNSVMDATQMDLEREVIFGEMRLNNDNPDRKIYQLTFQNAYTRHPYRYPVIGYKSLLAGVSQQDILDYYQTYYAPNNIIFSVAGNIKTEEVLSKIQKTFKNFERRSAVPRNLAREPQQISSRRHVEEYPTDLARLSMAFSGIPLLHENLYALDVVAKILGDGRSSRLYLDIYKSKELVHQISSYNYTPMDRGIFQIQALLEQEHVDQAIVEILQQITLIKKEGITFQELKKAKRQVLSEYIFGHQKASQVAYTQAVDEAFAGDFQFSRKYIKGVNKVTNEDIKRVARQYLKKSALTTVILRPEQKKIATRLEPAEKVAGVIQKYVLGNGLTVLLREDHEFPLVSIRFLCNGGTRQEKVEYNGISKLTASLWIRGTKSQTAKQIAEKTEDLGMALGSYSGKNSFGVNLELLSEDINTGWDLLVDLVDNPVFPEEEMLKVKTNMKTALRQRDDDIFYFTSQALKEAVFLKNPFRLDTNGTKASIDRINKENVLQFYHQLVVPSNMVLTVFGDMDSKETLEQIKKRFGSLKKTDLLLKTHEVKAVDSPRAKTLYLDKEQAMVMFGFQGASMSNKDRYGLKVLSSILGSSFSGRLFGRIREELGQAYTLGGSAYPGVDTGFIYFYVLTSEEKVQKIKELVNSEIQKIQTEGVSAKELLNMKTYLKGNFKAGYETNSSLSFISGLDELYGLGFKNYQEYDKNIDAVTQDDIKTLAQKYLDLNKVVTVTTIPESMQNKGSVQK